MLSFGNVSIDIAPLANTHFLSIVTIYQLQHQEREPNTCDHPKCLLTVIQLSIIYKIIGKHPNVCYGPNVCILPNSYVEILTPNMMVLGGRSLGGVRS